MADRSSPHEVINPGESTYTRVAGPNGRNHDANLFPPDVTGRAIAALREQRATYTSAQVAYLMALAFHSGVEFGKALIAEDLAEDVATWQEYAQPRQTREQRIAARLAEMDAAERARIRREQHPAPAGQMKDADWPPVAVPGMANREKPPAAPSSVCLPLPARNRRTHTREAA